MTAVSTLTFISILTNDFITNNLDSLVFVPAYELALFL